MSRNDDADCSGMAASFSSRWSRHGEWTSRSGTAKIRRRQQPEPARSSSPRLAAGRRPMTWSHWSMASSSGSRWALRPGFLRGRHEHQRQAGPVRPRSKRAPEADPSDRNDASLDRPSQRRDLVGQWCDDGLRALGRQVGEQDDPDPGVGQRIAPSGSAKGSSLASLVVIRTPVDVRPERTSIKRSGLAGRASARPPGGKRRQAGARRDRAARCRSSGRRSERRAGPRLSSRPGSPRRRPTSSARVTRVPANGIPSVSARPQDVLPGHSRQDLMSLGRPLETALPHPEQATNAWPR